MLIHHTYSLQLIRTHPTSIHSLMKHSRQSSLDIRENNMHPVAPAEYLRWDTMFLKSVFTDFGCHPPSHPTHACTPTPTHTTPNSAPPLLLATDRTVGKALPVSRQRERTMGMLKVVCPNSTSRPPACPSIRHSFSLSVCIHHYMKIFVRQT